MEREDSKIRELYEEIADVLDSGYPHDIKDDVLDLLGIVGPTIGDVALGEDPQREDTLTDLWDRIKKKERIRRKFEDALEEVDRLVIIYVSSKFENNEWTGTNIVKKAIEAELAKANH